MLAEFQSVALVKVKRKQEGNIWGYKIISILNSSISGRGV
jgi:hypothetical protein